MLAPAILALAVLGAALASWLPGLDGPYQFDDAATPLGDPASQSLAAWREHLARTLRPLTKLSYALEAEAGLTEKPAARRMVSLALHVSATVMLYLLILRLQPDATRLGASCLAVLWLLHPVHADSVLLLSGRSALLSGLLLLAALLALERSRPPIAALLFALACLARETALAGLLPLAVVAATRPGTNARAALRDMAPLLATSAVVLCWIATTPRYVALAEYSFLGRPLWHSVVAQVSAVPVGLALLAQPSRLSIDYGIPLAQAAGDPLFAGGLLLFGAACAGIARFRRRARAAAVGLALWLAALLPTQSVIPKLDALSNRPLALALAGLLLAAAPLLAAAIRRGRDAPVQEGRIRVSAVAPIVAALVVAGLLASATARRSELFGSELSLWQDAAKKSRTNARPHLQYAMLLIRAGQAREAWPSLAFARAIDPFSALIEDVWKANRPNEETP